LADESKSGTLKISSQEELQKWLESLPPEQGRWVAIAIAARAALRVLPLIALDAPRKNDAEHKRWFESLAFAVFFAVASARVWAKYPSQLGRVNARSAAHAAITASHLAAVPRANAAARSAAKAAGAAAEAVTTLAAWRLHALDAVSIAAAAVAGDAAFASAAANEAQAKNSAQAKEAAKRATDEFAADIWEAVTADANIFRHLAIPRQFVDLPLWAKSNTGFYGDLDSRWVNIAPASFDEDRRKFFQALSSDINWGVWLSWSNRRINGVSDPEEIELVFATVPDKEREAGPAAANKWIKERLEELQSAVASEPVLSPEVHDFASLADRPNVSPPSPSPVQPAWDYFISYSALEEADAREVAAVLEQAGLTTFAQFKDIAPGNNFVREMQSGLDDSGRMVALYSPEYENSDHCQAEWSAAYNSDPSGKKRKLIPFLLRPTALNSLARQVAYKSLVGLSKEARKAAILDAIAPTPAKEGIARVRAELAETASPQPALNENRQLDAGPNRVFDRPFVDQDLVDLPYTQRALIKAILRALPRNTPKIMDSALRSYDEHIQERGSQPITRLLNDFAAALEKEVEAIRAKEPELLGPGNASLFESFLRNNALLATHFPLKSEEKFAEVSIDEERATGDALVRPIKDVAEKMNDAVASGIATEKIGQIASNSAQFATDIAPLPPDASASEPGSRRVTLKRRYVLGTLGFLVALYNLLGSTASILATEQGAALFEAVRKAIEALSKFLL